MPILKLGVLPNWTRGIKGMRRKGRQPIGAIAATFAVLLVRAGDPGE